MIGLHHREHTFPEFLEGEPLAINDTQTGNGNRCLVIRLQIQRDRLHSIQIHQSEGVTGGYRVGGIADSTENPLIRVQLHLYLGKSKLCCIALYFEGFLAGCFFWDTAEKRGAYNQPGILCLQAGNAHE